MDDNIGVSELSQKLQVGKAWVRAHAKNFGGFKNSDGHWRFTPDAVKAAMSYIDNPERAQRLQRNRIVYVCTNCDNRFIAQHGNRMVFEMFIGSCVMCLADAGEQPKDNYEDESPLEVQRRFEDELRKQDQIILEKRRRRAYGSVGGKQSGGSNQAHGEGV